METSSLVFVDSIGRVLAKTSIPDDSLTEGEHGSVKQFEITASVTVGGKVDHYIFASTNGNVIKGKVVQKPITGPGFALDRLEVKAGELIKATVQALTVKEPA